MKFGGFSSFGLFDASSTDFSSMFSIPGGQPIAGLDPSLTSYQKLESKGIASDPFSLSSYAPTQTFSPAPVSDPVAGMFEQKLTSPTDKNAQILEQLADIVLDKNRILTHRDFIKNLFMEAKKSATPLFDKLFKFPKPQNKPNAEQLEQINIVLLNLAFAGIVDGVEYLAKEAFADIKSAVRLDNQNTALHEAMLSPVTIPSEDVLTTTKYLLSQGVNIAAAGENKTSALHLAITRVDLRLVKLLVEDGRANLTQIDAPGNTALHHLLSLTFSTPEARKNALEIAFYLFFKIRNYLLKNVAQESLLHLAAKQGWSELVKLLLETGKFDINAAKANGQTPLHLCLLAPPNQVPTADAVATTKCLLSNHAEITADKPDHNGNTLLHHAASQGNHLAVKHLAEQTASNLQLENHDGLTPLQVAVCGTAGIEQNNARNSQEVLATIKYLASKKSNFDCLDKAKNSLLHAAVRSNHLAVVGYLVNEQKIDLERRNIANKTPLQIAVENEGSSATEIVSCLVAAKANIHVRTNKGENLLHLASPETVEYIAVKFPELLDQENEQALTPLQKEVFESFDTKKANLLIKHSTVTQLKFTLRLALDKSCKLIPSLLQALRDRIDRENLEHKTNNQSVDLFQKIIDALLLIKTRPQSMQQQSGISDPELLDLLSPREQSLDLENLKLLLNATNDISQSSKEREQALGYLVSEKNYHFVEVFLQQHTNADVRAHLTDLALTTAASKNNLDGLLRILLENSSFYRNPELSKRCQLLCKTSSADSVKWYIIAAVRKLGSQQIKVIVNAFFENKECDLEYFLQFFQIGLQLAQQLKMPVTNQHNRNEFTSQFENVNKRRTEEYQRWLEIISKQAVTKENYSQLSDSFNEYLLLARKFKTIDARPIAAVIKDFETIQFPLDPAEIKLIANQYTTVTSFEEKLITASEGYLQIRIQHCKDNINNTESKLELLAIIIEKVSRIYGIVPNMTQILNVLALFNAPNGKRVAQILTGEGKTLLFSGIEFTWQALMSKDKIDLITVAENLSVRDLYDLAPLFGAFKINTTRYISGHSETAEQQEYEEKMNTADILFTGNDIVHRFLIKGLESDLQKERSRDTAGCDEFDGPIFDRINPYIISSSEVACVKEALSDAWELFLKDSELTGKKLKNYLDDKYKPLKFPAEEMNQWLSSLQAAKNKEEKIDYVVQDQQIKIIDRDHSGEVLQRNRWSYAIHCFLELKHKLPMKNDSSIIAFMYFSTYLRLYKKTYGVTGTIGAKHERTTLQDERGISTYNSPPYRPSQKIAVPPIIVNGQEEHDQKILASCEEMIKANRPILILCKTVRETERLLQFLQKNNITAQIYNGIQNISSNKVLALAGKPGMVTLATNIAGRGADIKLHDINSGLHVIPTFLPINSRVADQNTGRGGRQGQPGSYQYIVKAEDFAPFRISMKKPDGSPKAPLEIFDEWQHLCEKMQEFSHQVRDLQVNVLDQLAFEIQFRFFNLPIKKKLTLKTSWREHVEKLYDLCQEYKNLAMQLLSTDKQIAKTNIEKDFACEAHKIWADFCEINRIANNFPAPSAYEEFIKEDKDNNPPTAYPMRALAMDFDHTLLGVHTNGIALTTEPKALVANFKAPEKLRKFLIKMIDAKLPMCIVTHGIEIEFKLKGEKGVIPLLISGKASVEAHLKALLGDEYFKKANINIYAAQVKDGCLLSKVTYFINRRQLRILEQILSKLRSGLQAITSKYAAPTEPENLQKQHEIQQALHDKIQEFYNCLLNYLSQIDNSQVESNPCRSKAVYGKIPQIEQFLQRVKLVNPRELYTLDDEYVNRAFYRRSDFTVVEEVNPGDHACWTEKLTKAMNLVPVVTEQKAEQAAYRDEASLPRHHASPISAEPRILSTLFGSTPSAPQTLTTSQANASPNVQATPSTTVNRGFFDDFTPM